MSHITKILIPHHVVSTCLMIFLYILVSLPWFFRQGVITCGGAVLLGGFFFCSFLRACRPLIATPVLHSLELIVIFCVLGYSLARTACIRTQTAIAFPLVQVSVLEGRLVADSSITAQGQDFIQIAMTCVERRDGGAGQARGMVRCVVSSPVFLPAGTLCRVEGRFPAVVQPPFPEGLSTEIPGFFEVDSFVVASPHPNFIEKIISHLNVVRVHVLEKFSRVVASPYEEERTALILCRMMLMGRSDDPSFPLKDKAMDSGVSHVLALSGSHLAWLSTVLIGLTWRMAGMRKARSIAVSGVVLFVVVAGPAPSLLRACLMYLWGAVRPSRPCAGSSVETMAATILLAFSLFPFQALSLGFVLSMTAVLGITVLSPFLSRLLGKLLPLKLASSLALSISALCAATPCSLGINGFWTPVGIVLTPVATILSAGSLLSGLLLVVCPVDSYPGRFARMMATSAYRHMDSCLEWGARWSHTHRTFCTVPAFFYACIIMLTVIICIQYAGSVRERRMKECYELEFCLRFSQCHQPSPATGVPGDEQAVWTELPSAVSYQEPDS